MDQHSLVTIPEDERINSSFSTFINWLSASSSVSIVIIGAIIIRQYENINFFTVALLSSLSFLIIGIISYSGFLTGLPTMGISLRIFGVNFNRVISLINWLSQVGWETISLLMITYDIDALVKWMGFNPYIPLSLTFICAIILAFLVPMLGYEILLKVQSVTLVVMLLYAGYMILSNTRSLFHAIMVPVNLHDVVSAFSLAIVGGVFSWTMFCADYSRFVKRSSSRFSVIMFPSIGGFIGNFTLLTLSFILCKMGVITINGSGLIYHDHIISGYLFVLLLIFSILSLLIANYLTAYSSAFSVASFMQRDYNRSLLVGIDSFIAITCAYLILYIFNDFESSFVTFLSYAVIAAAPWTGVAVWSVTRSSGLLNIGKFSMLSYRLYIVIFILSIILEITLLSLSNIFPLKIMPALIPVIGFSFPIFLCEIYSNAHRKHYRHKFMRWALNIDNDLRS